MENRLGTSRLLALAGVVLAATFSIRAHGAEFRLRWLSPEGAGPARIQLTADPGPVYTIERSTNLAQWLPVLSGPLTNGTLDLFAPAVPGPTAAFYRGRVADATNSSPPIQVSLDLRRVGVALVTPEAGGSCAVTNDAGVRFTFTVGPSNVIEAVPVVMTLIKQLTGLPETEGPPAAVHFDPDGYEFLGSGTLEILYPTNLNVLAMSSFSCNGDGSDLHLMPDTVETNRVVLSLTHFSADGGVAFTKAGSAQMQGLTVSDPVNAPEQAFGSTQAKNLREQLEGKTPTQTTFEEDLLKRAEGIWLDLVLPYVAEANHNCDEARRLTRILLDTEKHLQQLAGNKLSSPYLERFRSDGTPAVWICNCVQQGQDACRSGAFEAGDKFLLQAEEIRSQLGVGMDQLKGCLPDPAPPNLKKLMDLVPCKSSWKGNLTFTSVKKSTSDYHDFFGVPFEHSEQTDVFTFLGHVVSSTFSSQTDLWELNVLGVVSGTHAYQYHEWHGLNCTHHQVTDENGEVPASSTLSARVILDFKGTQLAFFRVEIPEAKLNCTRTYLNFYEDNPLFGKCNNPPQSGETTPQDFDLGNQFYYSTSDGESEFTKQSTSFTKDGLTGVTAAGIRTYKHPGSNTSSDEDDTIGVYLDLH